MIKRIQLFALILQCLNPIYLGAVNSNNGVSPDFTVQYSDEEEYEGEDDEGGEGEQENEEEES